MIMRLVREKVQKNTAFKESTLAPTPQLLAGRIYIQNYLYFAPLRLCFAWGVVHGASAKHNH